MEIAASQSQNSTLPCSKCHKKQELIQKYENLITLLKKKADRSQLSQLSQSNKFSLGDVTTSNTSVNNASRCQKHSLAIILNRLQQSTKIKGFYSIRFQSYMQKCKIGNKFLSKLQSICASRQRQCIKQMKTVINESNQKNENILQTDSLIENNNIQLNNQQSHGVIRSGKRSQRQQQNSPLNKKSTFSQPQNLVSLNSMNNNYKSLAYVHQDLITSINQSLPNTLLRQQSLPFLFTKKQTSSTQQMKSLYKKLFALEQQNFSYQDKIKNLQKNMEEALNRQIKENRKKTQSLEMVAEQMAQKNQLIIQLQEKITMLEERYDCENNGVLEDQLTQNRKQVQKLEKVNIKLDNELRKTREKLIQTQEKLKTIQLNNEQLTKSSTQLKQALFQMQQKILTFSQTNQTFKSTCHKLQKLFQKLKHHQKSVIKVSQLTQNPSSQPSNKQCSQLQQQYKLQLVFIYLYNIEDQHYDFSQHSHLFDEEQLQVLRELKEKFNELREKLQHKQDLMQSIEWGTGKNHHVTTGNNFRQDLGDKVRQGNGQNHQGDNDTYAHNHLVDGSIFQVLNDQRNHDLSRIQPVPKPSQRQSPQNNLTMKLLQLQIQKNKQIQKISQLKEKNMYVRNIILNLMKSLELKQTSLKTQTAGILDLIFDVFEYSEEQKQIIFVHAQQQKERKFFGFI